MNMNAVCLTPAFLLRTLKRMEVHFTPDVEAKLHALATETGRAADEFVQDALAGYFEEIAQVRGSPVGTVKTQMRSAIQKLRRQLT